jgi:hypothetical protein
MRPKLQVMEHVTVKILGEHGSEDLNSPDDLCRLSLHTPAGVGPGAARPSVVDATEARHRILAQ